MVLKRFATAAAVLLVALLAAGCGANPAATLNDCIMEGVRTLASSQTETHSIECAVPLTGPYQVMLFPPRSLVDKADLEKAESNLLAAAKASNLPGPTHESIYVIPGDGQSAVSFRQSYAPIQQIHSLSKADGKLTVLLERVNGAIRIADMH
ncbi:MAG TPA: hypothetical protein VL025_05050 [Thermoanaerobaculia bacterium]|nr:hypothetical protein [Thermoanaerobaculia bacterium]